MPPDAVYVGRPTKWGNRYSHLDNSVAEIRVRTRAEAIEAYRDWFLNSEEAAPLRAALGELRGKDLVCWCAPLPCHANVLLELANARRGN